MLLCLSMENPCILLGYLGKAFVSLEADFYFVLYSCDPGSHSKTVLEEKVWLSQGSRVLSIISHPWETEWGGITKALALFLSYIWGPDILCNMQSWKLQKVIIDPEVKKTRNEKKDEIEWFTCSETWWKECCLSPAPRTSVRAEAWGSWAVHWHLNGSEKI